jgi:glycosyltransferase involved in cell wall biosynthesis
MKILWFMDGIGNAGGIQEQVIKWLDNFSDDIQVDFLAYYQVDINGKRLNNEADYINRLKKYNCNCYLITPFRKGMYFRCLRESEQFFREHHDYDIVQVHGSTKCMHIMRNAKKYGIKVRIAHSHNTRFQTTDKFKILIGDILKRQYNKLSTAYFACTPDAGKWLFGDDIVNSDRFYYIQNAVDTTKFNYSIAVREEMREKLGIPLGDKVIIHVGRFMNQKNHKYLIEIFNEVAKLDSSYHLLLVGDAVRGDTSFKDYVVSKVQEYGLNEKVHFLGVRKDVNELMNCADILVFPSLYEGLGLVCIEAQATGLPCLVSDTIPVEAKVSHLLKFKSLQDSPAEWAKCALDMVNDNQQRECPMQEIIDAGYEIKTNTQYIEEIYKHLIKN